MFLAVILGQVGFAVENARLLKRARESAVELQRAINHKDIQLQDAHRKIIQAEKLSALGQVIAGVAHEINNPLTSVTGYAELLLLKHDSQMLQTESLRENLRTIHEEAIRATRIVQNLLSFAREKKPEMRMADVNEVVRKVLHLRQYDLETHGIQVTLDLDPNLPGTMLDADQIQQVVLNLVNNSAQALTEDGPRHVQIGTRFGNGEILLSVSDTGQGIPAAVIDRIFDPFFTTKSGKVNSGLGLSISYGIIREHGGTIEVDSTEGQGTRMTLRLPVVSVGAKEPSAGEDERESYHSKDGLRALVVDDEASIARLMAEMLATAGFQVETSASGMEALEKIREMDYDLVISDLRMPDLGGMDLFEKIKSSKPHMAGRIILTSGDVTDQHAREFADSHHVRLIAKPFSHRDLLRAAEEVLGW
jgi:two-component system NtrC family sensor kinase